MWSKGRELPCGKQKPLYMAGLISKEIFYCINIFCVESGWPSLLRDAIYMPLASCGKEMVLFAKVEVFNTL